MTDEPTTGELRRNLDDVRADLRERHTALGQRLDAMAREMVPHPLFAAHLETARREHDELGKDIADLGARLEADQRQRAADRRLILMALFTSIIAPVLMLLIQAAMSSRGAAP